MLSSFGEDRKIVEEVFLSILKIFIQMTNKLTII